MKIQAGQLASHLRNDLARCYLVSGDEHLLVDEALDAIRDAARASGFGARERHVATAGFDWSELGTSGANLSLFAERRLVELWLPTGKPGRTGGQAIVDFIDRLGDDVMFVVSTPKLDKSTQGTKWVKAVQGKGVFVPVWPVGARELPGWIAVADFARFDRRVDAAQKLPFCEIQALVRDRAAEDVQQALFHGMSVTGITP